VGGVESGPGPEAATTASASRHDALSLGLHNVRSARHKAVLIHDVMNECRLDELDMTETWIPSDAPDAVKLDIAPSVYKVVHRHCGLSADKRNGGVALVHRDAVRATTVDGDYTEFESLAVKLVCRQSKSVLVVCVYRPPGAATPSFTDQLSDPFDQLLLPDAKFVVVGDFSVPGDNTRQLDRPLRSSCAHVLPLLKKTRLDSSSLANYRPISSLSAMSKIIEQLVMARLRPHLLASADFSEN